MLSPLLILAQAAALSAAFLVPPGISDKEIEEFGIPTDFSIDEVLAEPGQAAGTASVSRLVRMPCDGCAYKEEGMETDLVSFPPSWPLEVANSRL